MITFDPSTALNTLLSNGNLTAATTGGGNEESGVRIATSLGKTSGKYYFEFAWTHTAELDGGFCIGLPTATYAGLCAAGGGLGGIIVCGNGAIAANGIFTGNNIGGMLATDVVGMAIDLDNRKAWFKIVAGLDIGLDWNGGAGANPVTNVGGITILSGTIVPIVVWGADSIPGSDIMTANFGASAFSGTIPSGFITWPEGGVNVTQSPDLDKGGTFRQYMRVWMGASVGWLTMPFETVYPINAAGTYTLERWTNLVKINVAGNITINLPSSKASPQGPQAIPGQWVLNPVTIVDIGGHSASFTYTIVPNGAELISGLSTVNLAANFGTVILEPLLETGGWNLIQ